MRHLAPFFTGRQVFLLAAFLLIQSTVSRAQEVPAVPAASYDLVVTCSTDVTSTQRQAIQLEYTFNSRSVSAVSDQNGGFGATLTSRKSY